MFKVHIHLYIHKYKAGVAFVIALSTASGTHSLRRAITTAAERYIRPPQISTRLHTRGFHIVDQRVVLTVLSSFWMVGDWPEDEAEARLVGGLVGILWHLVEEASAPDLGLALYSLLALYQLAVVLGGDEGERARCLTLILTLTQILTQLRPCSEGADLS